MKCDQINIAKDNPGMSVNQIASATRESVTKNKYSGVNATKHTTDDDEIMADSLNDPPDDAFLVEGDIEGEKMKVTDTDLDDKCIEYELIEAQNCSADKGDQEEPALKKSIGLGVEDTDEIDTEISDRKSQQVELQEEQKADVTHWVVLVAPITLQDLAQHHTEKIAKLCGELGFKLVRTPSLTIRKENKDFKKLPAALSLLTSGILHLRVRCNYLVQVMKMLLQMDLHAERLTVSIRQSFSSDKSELDVLNDSDDESNDTSKNVRSKATFFLQDTKKVQRMVSTSAYPDNKDDLKHRCLYLKEVPDTLHTVLLNAVFPMALSVDRIKVNPGSDYSSVIMEMASSEQTNSILHIYQGLTFGHSKLVDMATSTRTLQSVQKSIAREIAATELQKSFSGRSGKHKVEGEPQNQLARQAAQFSGSSRQQQKAVRGLKIRRRPRHRPFQRKSNPSPLEAFGAMQQQAVKLAEMERKVAFLQQQAQMNQMAIMHRQNVGYPSGFADNESMYQSGNFRSTNLFQMQKSSNSILPAQQRNPIRKRFGRKR